MIAVFLKSLVIGYSGAIMPGSLFAYTVDKSLRHGAKSGLLISLGHILLELVLVVLIFAGFGKYLAGDVPRSVIGLIGGVVLGYMGFGMLKDIYLNRISLDIENHGNDKKENMLLTSAVLSATNPYFIIWWSAIGLTLVMNSYSAFGITGIVLFYTGHIISDISWFTFVSILISRTRHIMNIKVYKGIVLVLGVCLIGFGISFFAGSVGTLLY